MKHFFAELKRRNVYKVAVAYAMVACLLIMCDAHHSLKSPECSCVSITIASFIVNANHCIM
jgi:hypothetical protein